MKKLFSILLLATSMTSCVTDEKQILVDLYLDLHNISQLESITAEQTKLSNIYAQLPSANDTEDQVQRLANIVKEYRLPPEVAREMQTDVPQTDVPQTEATQTLNLAILPIIDALNNITFDNYQIVHNSGDDIVVKYKASFIGSENNSTKVVAEVLCSYTKTSEDTLFHSAMIPTGELIVEPGSRTSTEKSIALYQAYRSKGQITFVTVENCQITKISIIE